MRWERAPDGAGPGGRAAYPGRVDGRPVVTVALHGVAQDDDLGVQAFARHLEAVADHGSPGRSIVAGMRAFLEAKPQLAPPPPGRRRRRR